MHSAELPFSSVDFMNHVGDVVDTGHLRGHVLPSFRQRSKFSFCCTLNESGGEIAMLIRGCKNWGLCIGKWDGVFDGVFLACLDHEHHDTNNSSAPAGKFEVRRTTTSFCKIDEP